VRHPPLDDLDPERRELTALLVVRPLVVVQEEGHPVAELPEHQAWCTLRGPVASTPMR
jgi:hypothetical protein